MWINVALAFLKKAWPFILIAVLGGLLALSQHNLGNARDKLAGEAAFRHTMAGTLNTTKDDQAHLLFIAGQRMLESENRRLLLDNISNQAKQANERSAAADKALAEAQAENNRKLAAAQRQIGDLQKRKATGDREADWKAIENDSKSAWEGWHGMVNDDHVWRGAEFRRSAVIVQLTTYNTSHDLLRSLEEQIGHKLPAGSFVYGWSSSVLEDPVCNIHIVDPEQDYDPVTLGHELAHCFYGSWHEERF